MKAASVREIDSSPDQFEEIHHRNLRMEKLSRPEPGELVIQDLGEIKVALRSSGRSAYQPEQGL